ncbi:MAG: hypothetical protein HC771_18035 [Synechococcales cyanobacterium CRU_2_2]|nr:hypothetical protein [Synechococcales cyanobacterium CRU_2_2]
MFGTNFTVENPIQQAYTTQISNFFADEAQADATERLLLQHSWPLEPFAMPNLQEPSNRVGMPQAVLDAHDYYATHVMAQDWGTVHAATLLVGEQITLAVYVETDGGDGWLEVYDLEGTLLGAARTDLGEVNWGEAADIRQQVLSGGFPEVAPGEEVLDKEASLRDDRILG